MLPSGGRVPLDQPSGVAQNGRSSGKIRHVFSRSRVAQVDLFGKAAWAHDEISDPVLNVSFIGLPIASFAVNGAAPPHDLGLLTAGAEWRLARGASVLAKFDGEFAGGYQTCSGTARLRYTW
jgi:uncharacterized protein with beta-barrel porin domain